MWAFLRGLYELVWEGYVGVYGRVMWACVGGLCWRVWEGFVGRARAHCNR